LVWLAASIVSLGLYLVASDLIYRPGFPLDDAWIHQAYARNLALRGEWALVAGQPSAGSTAPLWSALLVPAHLVGGSPVPYAYLLGWAVMIGTAYTGARALDTYLPGSQRFLVWAGIVLLFEWRLVWSSVSGMETGLFALIVTAVLVWLAAERPHWLGLGLLVGLSTWVRPDGLTLLGPIALVAVGQRGGWRSRLQSAGLALAGFGLLFLPYLVFNQQLAGDLWPNTFYAKQAEYASLRAAPYWLRLFVQLRLPLIGVGAALLPGALIFAWRSWQSRRWPVLAACAWWLGYHALYAWRLPVTYQHGRYLIPAVPIFTLLGLAGMIGWIKSARPGFWHRVIARTWVASTALVLLVFWILGARAYGRDVAFIESEMVAAAEWIGAHTPEDSLVAAHDIGAVGYYGGRELLDLAGLVSPEVIPFIRDEGRLAAYLDARGADYLVTFPGWYPDLVGGAEPVFETHGTFGLENMAVFHWPGSLSQR
jgi:hypothetical protein